MRLVITVMLCCIVWGCKQSADIVIIDKPITFDAEREQLSLEYLRKRHGLEQGTATINPQMVVVHWTVIPTLEGSFKAFDPVKLPSSRSQISGASELNVSAHFLVDRDGTIYQLLPSNTFARHTIGLNHTAIGIENIADGKSLPLTDEQIRANIDLILHLSEQHQIEYVIGHHEYQQFIGHPLWLETDATYLTTKTDPGDSNMRRIRAGLARLDLRSVPQYINPRN